ncbi:hypothetical protein LZC95_16840 [Pendulispora brunnea]|uniref:Uncharacterized protein n=1 Tax=Pendulispora brunnea TaxID=2905690 RepID=A0ABZ2KIL2_9BACT
MRTLTRMEMRWAYAAFGAIFPSGASQRIPLGICDLDLETYLTQIRSRVPYRSALGLRVAIWVIALAPMFVLCRACTIMSLDSASRETLLRKMLASPVYVVRQLVMLLKAVGAVLYAGTPAVNQAILATSHPELNQSGTRLIGIGRKPGAEHEDQHEDDEDEERHDEQSVA